MTVLSLNNSSNLFSHLLRFKFLALLMVATLMSSTLTAQTLYFSVGSGDFSDLSIWNDGIFGSGNAPTALTPDDAFFITNGDVVNIDQNITANAINVFDGTLNIPSPFTLMVTGSLIQGVNVDLNGTLNIAAGATLDINNVGDGDFDDDGIRVLNDMTINGTLTISNFDDGDGIFMDLGAALTIASTASVTINGNGTGTNGINIFDNTCTLDIEAGAMLNISDVNSDGIDAFDGTVTNAGTITIEDTSSDGIFCGDNFTNESTGIITITNAGQEGIECTSTSFFENAGDITINTPVGSAIRLINSSRLTNTAAGTIIASTPGRSGLQGAFNSTFNNQGIFEVNNPAIRYAENPVLNNNGVLRGEGLFNAGSLFLQVASIIAPGSTTRQMSFDGNENFSNAVLEIDVTDASNFDAIDVTGTATLGGGLNVNINYSPTSDDRLVFLTATTSVSGTFTLAGALPTGWTVDYSVAGEVALQFTQVLPVDWIRFEVTEVARTTALLQWETATETNNRGFTILHSTDGRDWKDVGFVDGSGTSQQRQAYTFTHSTPRMGENYYRLRQVDYDGQSSQSEIRTIQFAGDSTPPKVEVYPNPAVEYAQITLPIGHAAGQITVVASNGQIVQQILVSSGQPQVILDVQRLPAGQYQLHVELGSKLFTQPLIRIQ